MAIGLSALNDIEWQRTLKECLITGRICHSARVTSECHSLPFSEQSERMSFCYAKKENITNKVKHKSNRNLNGAQRLSPTLTKGDLGGMSKWNNFIIHH